MKNKKISSEEDELIRMYYDEVLFPSFDESKYLAYEEIVSISKTSGFQFWRLNKTFSKLKGQIKRDTYDLIMSFVCRKKRIKYHE